MTLYLLLNTCFVEMFLFIYTFSVLRVFSIYLTTLSVAEIMQCRTAGRSLNDGWEWMWKKVIVAWLVGFVRSLLRCMCVCVCVCMYVCIYVCMCVCICMYVCITYVCIYVCICLSRCMFLYHFGVE
jgi:hypothetical protein